MVKIENGKWRQLTVLGHLRLKNGSCLETGTLLNCELKTEKEAPLLLSYTVTLLYHSLLGCSALF